MKTKKLNRKLKSNMDCALRGVYLAAKEKGYLFNGRLKNQYFVDYNSKAVLLKKFCRGKMKDES